MVNINMWNYDEENGILESLETGQKIKFEEEKLNFSEFSKLVVNYYKETSNKKVKPFLKEFITPEGKVYFPYAKDPSRNYNSKVEKTLEVLNAKIEYDNISGEHRLFFEEEEYSGFSHSAIYLYNLTEEKIRKILLGSNPGTEVWGLESERGSKDGYIVRSINYPTKENNYEPFNIEVYKIPKSYTAIFPYIVEKQIARNRPIDSSFKRPYQKQI